MKVDDVHLQYKKYCSFFLSNDKKIKRSSSCLVFSFKKIQAFIHIESKNGAQKYIYYAITSYI